MINVLSNLEQKKFNGLVAIRCTVNPSFIDLLDRFYLKTIMFPEFMRQTDDLKLDNPWVVVLGGPDSYTSKLKERNVL